MKKNFIKIFATILAVIMVASVCVLATSCSCADSSVEAVNGVDGKDGKNGVDGKDGASAYEIAVAAGFTGTEAEWLESLKGADGKDGKDGRDGIDGKDGKDGKDGRDGIDGKDGTAADANVYVGRDGYIYINGVNTGIEVVEPLNTTGVRLGKVMETVEGREVVKYFTFTFSAEDYITDADVKADVDTLFASVNIETKTTNKNGYVCFSNGKFITREDMRILKVELTNSDTMTTPKVFDNGSNLLDGVLNNSHTNYTVDCAGRTGVQIQFEYTPATPAIEATETTEAVPAVPALYSAAEITIHFTLWDVLGE